MSEVEKQELIKMGQKLIPSLVVFGIATVLLKYYGL